MLFPVFPKASAAYENTYVNTGNQAEDLIGVAMTQVGYTEGPDNDTKYGDWLGFPNLPWCASFISWCAYQADISPTVLARTALANPGENPGFNVPCYHGSEYTPKRGDLFFKEDFSHVGIVYGIEDDYVLTIEANTNDDGSEEGYAVLLRKRKIDECYFGVPAYKNCGEGHNYTIKYEPGHPHRRYYYCSTCRKAYYTGSKEHVLSCASCMKCCCSTSYSGYYQVSVPEGRIYVFDSHKANSIAGYLDAGELVYLVAGSSYLGHIIYANSAGYVQMEYLQKFVHAPTELASDCEAYYEADTAKFTWGSSISATDYIITVLKDDETLLSEHTGNICAYMLENLAPGDYQVQVQATDGTALSETVSCSFTVLPTYTITLDAMGGTGGASEQIKKSDQDLTLSRSIPTRDDCVLLGWSEDLHAKYASYQPGDVWTENRDVTLYAIWQASDAVATELQIFTPAPQSVYTVGQSPNTAGLVLAQVFSDGTMKLITEGYQIQGACSDCIGVHCVTITYEGLSVCYDIVVFANPIMGTDSSWTFQMNDVMQMMW